ncbi:MAG TPA: PQQ-binding-like beta-propeller repeat protein [Candidatus Nanoarchaeia archaeon]|nr:PQQ-binding-like beta-propeller repeat protein [Candidatus Nanoarchaeia archaeon]
MLNQSEVKTKKSGIIAIVALLILSMSASAMLLPFVHAATPMNIPTFAYISVSTNPVGINQPVEIIMWLNQLPFGTAPTNDIRFHNYKLTITAPDGTIQTKTFPVVSDPVAAQDTLFTPTQVGTYTLKFDFPGQVYTWPFMVTLFGPNTAYLNATYAASSATTTLTVQSAPVSSIPGNPYPSNFWTRPIYGTNSNWWPLASNWLGDLAPGYTGFAGTYNMGGNGEQLAGAGDVVGSLTSHIMWTMPIESGGIVGGNQTVIQGDSYFEGSAYEQRYDNPIVVDGILIFTKPVSFSGPSNGPTVAVDLRTGKQLWSSTTMSPISFAYVYDVQDPNDHGVYPPILISVSGGASMFGASPMTWKAYDAYTGTYMFTTTNITMGSTSTTMLGPEGEYLIISLANLGTAANPNWYLQEWNSSRLWGDNYSGGSTTPPVVPPVSNEGNNIGGNWAGGTIMAMGPFGPSPTYIPSMYDFNVSVPYLNSLGASPTLVGGIYGSTLLAYAGNLPSTGMDFMGSMSSSPYTYVTLNINENNPNTLGNVIWHETLNPPPNNITILQAGIDPVNRVFVENWRETQQYVGYSLDTGAKLWGPTVAQDMLDYYGSPASGSLANCFAYGKMYSAAYAGVVYCYDTLTGKILWTYGNGGPGNSTNSGLETPFGRYPTFINAIGSGLVYLVTSEHTIETPLFKGSLNRAINATTGAEVWTLSGYTGEFSVLSYAAADGYNTWFNGYDDQVYTVGRGPSATTVEAPLTSIVQGSSLTVQGYVTDISAGTTQDSVTANFPHGVPCASDASMCAWMGYVYQQQPYPNTATGVVVHLTAFDPNNNTEDLGYATTDLSGNYAIQFTPPVPGIYKITASFAGTNGYWPSSAETAISVSKAPSAAPATTSAPTAVPTQAPSTAPSNAAPTVTIAPTPSPAVTPPTSAAPTTTYIVIAAAIIIILAVATAIILRRRK